RSGIDHAVAEQNISSTVKTLEGIAMPGLSNEGLITMAIASSSLYHKDAELVVESLQNYIIQNLNAGYELEIEGLGTYRKPSGIEELNRNSKLEFDPLPWPDIP
ncbi:MAG: hypothetical protein ISS23_01135, partial [Nanoarchaeota archaeon]|nr:hypothetical protein [Nanoarchaeota archaeon]